MTTDFKTRIQEIRPDLDIETLEINQDGLVNDVAIVNNALVFRFIKQASYKRILDIELQLLAFIAPHISVAVPAPIERGDTYVVYPYLHGRPLLNPLLKQQPRACQHKLAFGVGEFLRELHNIDVHAQLDTLPKTLAPVTQDRWQALRMRIEKTVYPLLMPHQKLWADKLLNTFIDDPKNFAYAPALIHGDLAPYHLLVNCDKTRLMGVLDFGVAGVGDPAIDIAPLINSYGLPFVEKMAAVYPNLATVLPRAKFYAQAIELQWALLGLETGEPFWFTAHLGRA